ncbi:MAG: hypothetical protein Q8P52_00240 [bacterium]|nr:hypothetical protein [bacterium]
MNTLTDRQIVELRRIHEADQAEAAYEQRRREFFRAKMRSDKLQTFLMLAFILFLFALLFAKING